MATLQGHDMRDLLYTIADLICNYSVLRVILIEIINITGELS